MRKADFSIHVLTSDLIIVTCILLTDISGYIQIPVKGSLFQAMTFGLEGMLANQILQMRHSH